MFSTKSEKAIRLSHENFIPKLDKSKFFEHFVKEGIVRLTFFSNII